MAALPFPISVRRIWAALGATASPLSPAQQSTGGAGRTLVAQAKDALRPGEAGDGKFAELDPTVLGDAGEGRRRNHGPGELTRDLLQSCGEIDGGADAGEVEPAGAADIAEQDFTDMERDAKRKRSLPSAPG
jgi:hypothetical protein